MIKKGRRIKRCLEKEEKDVLKRKRMIKKGRRIKRCIEKEEKDV